MSEELKERAKELALELHRLLEENLIKDPAENGEAMAKIKAIRGEIEAMGFVVGWEVSLRPLEPASIKVKVTLWVPKANMTEEEQKIYDEWFAKANGIKPPQ